jgi:soluble lytic murein transglycosylase-like protein
MRWSATKLAYYLVAFTIALLLLAVFPVNADIYMYIDDEGVMHFTNTPTSSDHDYKLYIREQPFNSETFHYTDKYDDLIGDASDLYDVDSRLVKAIIKVESDFNPRAISKKGAMGLMQIMPENFQRLDIENPFDPKQNIMGGTRYFKQLYQRFNGKLALSLAAYNAGPTAVDQYKSIPPYKETEQYVQRVLSAYRNFKRL